jgi:hypothetical protein
VLIRLDHAGRWWAMAEATGWLLVHRHEGKDRHLGRYGSLEAVRAGAGEHGAPTEELETLDLLGGFPGAAEGLAGELPES